MLRSLGIFVALAAIIMTNPMGSFGVQDDQALRRIVAALDKTDNAAVQTALLRGMLSGLAGSRNVTAPKDWQRVSDKLAQSQNEGVRDLASQLAQIFGDPKATARALAIIQDADAETSARRTALRGLLTQQNDQVSDVLKGLLDDSEMRLDAIRGYSAIENAEAPQILLRRYQDLDQPLRRAVIETLASRKGYAQALLTSIKNDQISREEIPAHVARSLSILLGEDFVATFGEVRSLAKDRAKQMSKYKRMITPESLENASASRGRAVFQKTCASCHLLYGTGGKIGPDLTGSNRANLDYILLNSVDPSYDVPDGYKMVLIQTYDGRLINGVIAAEDDRRVVLKTVEQPEVIIAKDDIEARKVSPKSMMPDGQLDQMKPQEVIDLIKYLQTTEQVELPK